MNVSIYSYDCDACYLMHNVIPANTKHFYNICTNVVQVCIFYAQNRIHACTCIQILSASSNISACIFMCGPRGDTNILSISFYLDLKLRYTGLAGLYKS